MKFGWILIGVPLGYTRYGALGVVAVVATGDMCRYFPVLLGQFRERFSFATQDLLLTIAAIAMMGAWGLLRWSIRTWNHSDMIVVAFYRFCYP